MRVRSFVNFSAVVLLFRRDNDTPQLCTCIPTDLLTCLCIYKDIKNKSINQITYDVIDTDDIFSYVCVCVYNILIYIIIVVQIYIANGQDEIDVFFYIVFNVEK